MQNRKPYSTKQKNSLLEFLRQHGEECFTAKNIIEQSGLSIGEATVYRLLTKLTSEGKLNKFSPPDGGGSTYQYNHAHDEGAVGANHFHLKCLSCGETLCMDCSFMSNVESHIESEHSFSLDNRKTILYGQCGQCKSRNDTTRRNIN
jgi:Fur family ferric uptake transcriptional regulator